MRGSQSRREEVEGLGWEARLRAPSCGACRGLFCRRGELLGRGSFRWVPFPATALPPCRWCRCCAVTEPLEDEKKRGVSCVPCVCSRLCLMPRPTVSGDECARHGVRGCADKLCPPRCFFLRSLIGYQPTSNLSWSCSKSVLGRLLINA